MAKTTVTRTMKREQYLPDGVEEVKFYEPTNRGLEGKISEKLAHLAELDKQAKARKK
jgi:putative ATPase